MINLEVDVQCPFYRGKYGKNRIICEGLEDGSTLALTYKSRAKYERQVLTYCCDKYPYCEVYRMLMEAKYEEDDDDAMRENP